MAAEMSYTVEPDTPRAGQLQFLRCALIVGDYSNEFRMCVLTAEIFSIAEPDTLPPVGPLEFLCCAPLVSFHRRRTNVIK
jgi:hypothetical protein